jgi:hypothetical protein
MLLCERGRRACDDFVVPALFYLKLKIQKIQSVPRHNMAFCESANAKVMCWDATATPSQMGEPPAIINSIQSSSPPQHQHNDASVK